MLSSGAARRYRRNSRHYPRFQGIGFLQTGMESGLVSPGDRAPRHIPTSPAPTDEEPSSPRIYPCKHYSAPTFGDTAKLLRGDEYNDKRDLC